jgi:hypothetical protein
VKPDLDNSPPTSIRFDDRSNDDDKIMAVVVNDDPVPSLFRADDRQLLSVSTTEATTATEPWRWWSATTPFPLSSEQMIEQSKHEVGLLLLSTIHIEIHIHLKWEGYE